MTTKSLLSITSLSLIAFAQVLHSENPPSGSQAGNPSAELQGTWEGEEVGKESKGKWIITINGDTLDFEGPGKIEWYKATFKLSPDQAPKQLQATIMDCPKPDFVGQSALSIYKIENGTLTLTGNRPGLPDAPKDFNSGENSRTFVFKKASPAK
jgi:uncharacterized protein (TIGR03067 family)